MALHSLSLLNPPPLPPISDGVDFYVTECEIVLPPEATPLSEPLEPFRACTVLVSFARSESERAALLPLRHALAFGHTSSAVCDGAEWLQKLPKRLSERLNAVDHGLVTAVIYAGSGDDSDSESIQAVADALRQCFRASLAAVLVVADTSSRQFISVTGISGFVVGASGTNAETARSVFLCLAMLMAPKTLNGIDFVDLEPVFGTAAVPTVLIDALWLRGDDGRLDFSARAHARAIRSATRVVAFPLIDGPWSWPELRRFCEAVQDQAVKADSKVFFAPDRAIAPTLFSARVSTVPILCSTHR